MQCQHLAGRLRSTELEAARQVYEGVLVLPERRQRLAASHPRVAVCRNLLNRDVKILYCACGTKQHNDRCGSTSRLAVSQAFHGSSPLSAPPAQLAGEYPSYSQYISEGQASLLRLLLTLPQKVGFRVSHVALVAQDQQVCFACVAGDL